MFTYAEGLKNWVAQALEGLVCARKAEISL